MTTVFLLDGYAYNGFLPGCLKGEITAAPNNPVQVPYDNKTATAANITAAATMLNTFLTNPVYAGPKKVFAISMGCQVAAMWARNYGPTSTIPASDLSFLLLANPERKYTGGVTCGANILGVPLLHGYGSIGVPDGIIYPTTDFSVQYDGVADWPNATSTPNTASVLNATIGIGIIHMLGYYAKLSKPLLGFEASLTDPANVSFTEGQRTYVTKPLYPTASLMTQRLARWWVRGQDKTQRPGIESQYNRHMTIPLPSYDDTPTVYPSASLYPSSTVYPAT